MTLAQSLFPIVVCWAIIGGLGASLLLPAMQSLIHGNFQGAMQRKAYALVGAAAAIAAAIGPLVGGFITTYLSWRLAFLGEVAIIGIVLSGLGLVHDVPYTGDRHVDIVGAILSALGMGGVVVGILVWQEGGGYVGLLIAIGLVALGSLAWWLVKRKREGKPALIDAGLFESTYFRLGITGQTMQQIALGGLMIALPIFLQMVLEYSAMGAGLTLAPLSLSMFAVAVLAGKKAGNRSPGKIIRVGFLLLAVGVAVLIPVVPRADSGWAMVIPLLIAGTGLGLLVSQLNNYTLVSDRRGAGQRGSGRQLGRRVVRPLVRARLRRRDHARLTVARLHSHGGHEQGALVERAGAGLEGPRGERRGDDQHASGGAPEGAAARRAGRDHPHQYESAPDRAADRPAGAAARRPGGAVHGLPNDAAARP